MPPPPLSDAAVLELLRSSTDDKEKALGLEPYREDCPDQAASDEAWIAYYHQEWERVYRFGLAEDAVETLLKELDAPSNPNVKLGDVRDRDAICQYERRFIELNPFFTGKSEVHIPLPNRRTPMEILLEGTCLLALMTPLVALLCRDIRWLLLWLVGYAIRKLYFRQNPMMGIGIHFRPRLYQINPDLTFLQLAKFLRRQSQSRATAMEAAAKGFRKIQGS
jgi:hypothetical protein